MILRVVLFLVVVGTAAGTAAEDAVAAQAARVDVDQAPLYEGPGKRFQSIEALKRDEIIVVSNLPTEGFFKARTTSGAIGWVSAEVLVLLGNPDPGDSKSPDSRRWIALRLLAGMDIFSSPDVNNLVQFDAVKNGYSFGGEAGFFPRSRFAVLLRVERIFKDVVATDSATNKTYSISSGSLPVMLGVEWAAVRTPRFTVHLAALGGVGLSTQLTSVSTSDSAPNSISVSARPSTFLGKVDFAWNFSDAFSVFAEAGYRFLKTAALTPTERTANGASLLMVNGAFVPFVLSFSGPVLGLGLAVSF